MSVSRRLRQLEKNNPKPKPRVDTPEARRAYCREHGHPEDSLVLGLGGKMVIILPPQEPEP